MDHKAFLNALESGEIRTAHVVDGQWVVNTEVKEGILQVFKASTTAQLPHGFLDKPLLYPRTFQLKDDVRLVPGGSAIRAGAFIGPKVVIMPPSYVNIGAYVDEGTMIDSHVLVGSCAQIGRRVHLSAAVQIGGVLEPIGHRPVIVEDDCFIGAGVILVEGIIVRKKAVLAPGVILSASIPIYDTVHGMILKGEVPERAVVVPGARPMFHTPFARDHNLSLGCAVIVKYRDDSTDASVVLESCLR